MYCVTYSIVYVGGSSSVNRVTGVKNLALPRTGVPHISLVFSRDVGFHCAPTGIPRGCKGATNGRPPHLAKNARDMGHPGYLASMKNLEHIYLYNTAAQPAGSPAKETR